MGRLVAVTGATGFVGPHLVAALARRGWRLRLLVRRWSPLPSLAGVDAELVLGDVSSEQALRQLVAGADAVVHAAGLIKAKADRDFLSVNRDSAALLSALAPDAHMLLLSSLAAREPQLSAYSESKRAGEAVVAGRTGPWTIVRPGGRAPLSTRNAPTCPPTRCGRCDRSPAARGRPSGAPRPGRAARPRGSTG